MATSDNSMLNELKNAILEFGTKMDKHKDESDAKSEAMVDMLQTSILQFEKDFDQKVDSSFK